MSKKSNGKMTFKVVKMTPAMAAKLLDGMDLNRTLSRSYLEKLIRDINHGDWTLTHQGVAISTGGKLLDGQHRLAAVIATNKALPMVMATNVPDTQVGKRTMNAVDVGRSRSIGDQLKVAYGKRNTNMTAAILNRIGLLVLGLSRVRCTTVSSTVELLEIFEKEVNDLIHIASTAGPRLNQSAVLAPILFYMKCKRRKAEEFAKGLFELEGLTVGDPRLMLARYLTKKSMRGEKTRSSRTRISHIVCNAIMAFDNGDSVMTMRHSTRAVDWLLSLNRGLAEKIKEITSIGTTTS